MLRLSAWARALKPGTVPLILLLAVIGTWAEEPQSIDEKAEAYVDRIVAGQFAEAGADYDATMTSAFPPEKLEATWKAVEGQAGAFVERVSSRSEAQGPYTVVLVTCRFEKQTLDVRVVFDAESRIAGLQFVPSSGGE